MGGRDADAAVGHLLRHLPRRHARPESARRDGADGVPDEPCWCWSLGPRSTPTRFRRTSASPLDDLAATLPPALSHSGWPWAHDMDPRSTDEVDLWYQKKE